MGIIHRVIGSTRITAIIARDQNIAHVYDFTVADKRGVPAYRIIRPNDNLLNPVPAGKFGNLAIKALCPTMHPNSAGISGHYIYQFGCINLLIPVPRKSNIHKPIISDEQIIDNLKLLLLSMLYDFAIYRRAICG